MSSEKGVDADDGRKSHLAESSSGTSPFVKNEQRDRLEVLDQVLQRVRFGAHLDAETRRSICAVTPNAHANVQPLRRMDSGSGMPDVTCGGGCVPTG